MRRGSANDSVDVLPGLRCGGTLEVGGIINLILNLHLFEDLVDKLGDWICARGEEVLGFDETGESDGGQGEGAKELHGFCECGNLVAKFDAAADVDAQHGDLVFDAGKLTVIEVFEI